jgi:hypothetical protein
VDGTLAVFLWAPVPVIHMMWGVWTAVMSGNRFTVLCPAAHRAVSYLCRAVSPDHSNSHCTFEMSFHMRCVSWCRAEVPMISSIRRFRIRRCLVAVVKEMSCPWGGSPCFHESVSRRWSHAASLCQTLPFVSSQDLASASRVISAFDVHNHSRALPRAEELVNQEFLPHSEEVMNHAPKHRRGESEWIRLRS